MGWTLLLLACLHRDKTGEMLGRKFQGQEACYIEAYSDEGKQAAGDGGGWCLTSGCSPHVC